MVADGAWEFVGDAKGVVLTWFIMGMLLKYFNQFGNICVWRDRPGHRRMGWTAGKPRTKRPRRRLWQWSGMVLAPGAVP